VDCSMIEQFPVPRANSPLPPKRRHVGAALGMVHGEARAGGDEEEVAQRVMRSGQDADASGIADHRRADLQQLYPDGRHTCPGRSVPGKANSRRRCIKV